MADKLKIGAALLLVIAALAGFYYFNDKSLFLRAVAMIVTLAVVIAIMLQTAMGRDAWAFSQDSYTEVRKVVWPTRKEAMNTTMVVVGISVVMAIFLWMLDVFLIWGVRHLTGQGA